MKKLLLVLLLFPFLSISQTNDLAVDSVFHRMGVGGFFPDGLDYYKIPGSQTSPINFSALVSNVGTNDITNCFLTVQVWRDGTMEFEETSGHVDILAGNEDSLFISTTYTPIYVDDYELKYWVESDSIDDDNSNDTLSSFFEVTEYEYSRSNGIIVDTLYPADSSYMTGACGNVMEAHQPMCIGAVRTFVIPNAHTEFEVAYGAIYLFDGTTFSYEAQTNDYDIDGGGEMTLYFNSGVEIDIGNVFLVVVGYYTDSIGFRMAQKSAPHSTNFIGESGGFEFQPINIVDLSVLSVNSGCDIGLDEESIPLFQLNQNTPNPFNQNTTIAYYLEQPANVQLIVTDQVGKVVHNKSQGQQLGGDNSILLDCNDWSAGIYFYSLIVDGEKQTRRMVVR